MLLQYKRTWLCTLCLVTETNRGSLCFSWIIFRQIKSPSTGELKIFGNEPIQIKPDVDAASFTNVVVNQPCALESVSCQSVRYEQMFRSRLSQVWVMKVGNYFLDVCQRGNVPQLRLLAPENMNRQSAPVSSVKIVMKHEFQKEKSQGHSHIPTLRRFVHQPRVDLNLPCLLCAASALRNVPYRCWEAGQAFCECSKVR